MSLYQKATGIWHFDFVWKGRRFYGSTGERNRRRAKAVEDAEKIRVKTGSTKRQITLDDAAEDYWQKTGRLAANAIEDERRLLWLVRTLGPTKLMTDIAEPELSDALARRRGQGSRRGVRKGDLGRPVSNATLNRQVTQLYRRIHTHARKTLKADVADIDFAQLILDEPKERVRCLTPAQESRLLAHMRPDCAPIVRFSILTGARLSAAITLTRRQVDLTGAQPEARLRMKGGGFHAVPLTPGLVALLANEMALHDTASVFSFQPHDRHERPLKGKAGRRRAMTHAVLRRQWEKARDRAGLHDFRWHDFRHTAGTRALHAPLGNLRIAQNLLGHADIATTAKYAHADPASVAAMLAQLDGSAPPAAVSEPGSRPAEQLKAPDSRHSPDARTA